MILLTIYSRIVLTGLFSCLLLSGPLNAADNPQRYLYITKLGNEFYLGGLIGLRGKTDISEFALDPLEVSKSIETALKKNKIVEIFFANQGRYVTSIRIMDVHANLLYSWRNYPVGRSLSARAIEIELPGGRLTELGFNSCIYVSYANGGTLYGLVDVERSVDLSSTLRSRGIRVGHADFCHISLPKVVVSTILRNVCGLEYREADSALETLYTGIDLLPGPRSVFTDGRSEAEKIVSNFVNWLREQDDKGRELFSALLGAQQELAEGGDPSTNYEETQLEFQEQLTGYMAQE